MTNTARNLYFPCVACNKTEITALPAISVLESAKNWSSDHVQNGQNFDLSLNIGPAFSDRFQVLKTVWEVWVAENKMTEYRALRVKPCEHYTTRTM